MGHFGPNKDVVSLKGTFLLAPHEKTCRKALQNCIACMKDVTPQFGMSRKVIK